MGAGESTRARVRLRRRAFVLPRPARPQRRGRARRRHRLGPVAALVMRGITWLLAAIFCSFTIAAMYRFAPHRTDARWRWLTLGSVLATLLWLAATLGFGLYVAEFASYQATYGSLGAVVVLLVWLYVSAYAVLLGGIVNAEAERQTACDTTTGASRPIGQRGAVVADMSVAANIYPQQSITKARREGQGYA